MCLSTSISATINLSVVDGNSGEPLIGVSVYTDDYETFTSTTDFDGKVEIPDLGYREPVNFSYVGFQTSTVPFFQLRNLKVLKLYADQLGLDTLVIVGRKDESADEIPYTNETISAKEIALQNPQTTADALGNQAGVYVQRSQMGGGSPVIRGFEANRVLLVVDGVRMNNAIYRSGHLQNSITVDNSILEQMEVIYGPGSLTYGSDALGGVVHFRTRDPKLLFGESEKGYRMSSAAYGRFSTANLEKSIHYDLDYGNRIWGSLTSVSYSVYDDLRAGDRRPEKYPDLGRRRFAAIQRDSLDQIVPVEDENIQVGTGYNQLDLLQKIRIQPNDNFYMVLNGQYSTTSNVPRYDRLDDTLSTADELKFAEWYYGPQERILGSFKARILKNNFLFSDATFIASFQRIDEDRLNRRWQRFQRTWNSEDVQVYSMTADLNRNLDEEGRNVLSYGFDANFNTIQSRIREQIWTTGTLSEGRDLTRYPSAGSQMQTLGAYLNYRWSNSNKNLFFDAGARFTDVKVSAKYDEKDLKFINWPEEYFTGIENKNKDLSWAAGITYNSDNQFQLRLLSSRAFRAPNVDDLFKNRIKNDKAVLPNAELEPETAINGEITIAQTFGKMSNGTAMKVSATGFFTQLNNAIVRKDTGEQIEGEGGSALFDVQKNFNANNAQIYGFSGNVNIQLGKKVKIESGLNLTKGTTVFSVVDNNENIVFDTITPMDHIPPLYGRTSLTFQNKFITLSGVVRYNGAKALEEYSVTSISYDVDSQQVLEIDRTGSSDNLIETGTCVHSDGSSDLTCEGSLAWMTYNFYSSFKMGKKWTLDLAAENILDLHYRNFASGISAPGRNFILTLRAQF